MDTESPATTVYCCSTGDVSPGWSESGSTGGRADLILYDDNGGTILSPYIGLGGGVVIATGRGFQMRFELRDNWVNVPGVSGPTPRQGAVGIPGSSITRSSRK